MSVLQLYGDNGCKCLQNYWHLMAFYYSAPECFMHAAILCDLEGMLKIFFACKISSVPPFFLPLPPHFHLKLFYSGRKPYLTYSLGHILTIIFLRVGSSNDLETIFSFFPSLSFSLFMSISGGRIIVVCVFLARLCLMVF